MYIPSCVHVNIKFGLYLWVCLNYRKYRLFLTYNTDIVNNTVQHLNHHIILRIFMDVNIFLKHFNIYRFPKLSLSY